MSILKIGHRGAAGHKPENTLLSMRKALELGVDGIEFDIQMSKDGEPMVIHDDTLDRTTNGKGLVSQHSLKELQRFDAGQGERIPSLRDVMDMIDKRCILFIELKAENCVKPVADIIAHYIKHGWKYEQLPVCAFDHTKIADIRAINPQIQTCALMECIPVSLAAIAQEAGASSINPYIGCISQKFVDDAHKRGLKVTVWTADTPEHIALAKSLGVDGIISDYPDRL